MSTSSQAGCSEFTPPLFRDQLILSPASCPCLTRPATGERGGRGGSSNSSEGSVSGGGTWRFGVRDEGDRTRRLMVGEDVETSSSSSVDASEGPGEV